MIPPHPRTRVPGRKLPALLILVATLAEPSLAPADAASLEAQVAGSPWPAAPTGSPWSAARVRGSGAPGDREAAALVRAGLLPGRAAATSPSPVPTPQEEEGGGLLGIAKWTSLAVAVGASTWGFLENAQADDAFDTIEDVCDREPERCEDRTPDGSFADPLLEERFQKVLEHDDRAQVGLLLGQVAIATTVVLFILDLKDDGGAEDIPFRPPRTRIRNGRTELVTGFPVSFR